MKKNFLKSLVLLLSASLLFSACGKQKQNQANIPIPIPAVQDAVFPDIHVEANNIQFTVRFYQSHTAQALASQIPASSSGMLLPTSYDMDGIYKYYDIPERYLSALNIQPEPLTQIKAGEVLLNETGRLLLYLQDSEVNGDFMKIGYVVDMTGVASALGDSDLQFRISAAQ